MTEYARYHPQNTENKKNRIQHDYELVLAYRIEDLGTFTEQARLPSAAGKFSGMGSCRQILKRHGSLVVPF